MRAEAEAARSVVAVLAGELATVGPLTDRDTFRAAAQRVRERTGAKGKALFHPIRLAVTGEPEGVELDLAVPLIERGAALTRQGGPEDPPLNDAEINTSGMRRIASAAERSAAFLHELERTGSNT